MELVHFDRLRRDLGHCLTGLGDDDRGAQRGHRPRHIDDRPQAQAFAYRLVALGFGEI
jgi:hypothetical protein